MMNKDQIMPCQVCQTPVPFDTHQFLQGFRFSCPNVNCDASYGLPQDSQGMVKKTIDQLEKLKARTR
ncbi:hypothetical protein [Reichenbachiella sp.]|uniref:hypothetical protein n=1 Tax=Reichenbachiella sp. TaxID=2184521 RepID=UPI003BAF9549